MLNKSIAFAIAVRPWLWLSGVGAALAFSPEGWWRRPPFLPIPDRNVIVWRVTTAYGHAEMVLVPRDVVSYLEWRRKNCP
ncbi:MAG: hypothetical protein M3132_14610 [Actinomycetia bacterium]|nr:hypothetical protein [Actinomycetes bacterium]